MKRLLIALISGFFILLPLNFKEGSFVKAQNLSRSCRNYPYDLGINLREMRNGSFRLISTSIVNKKIDNKSFTSRALREANLRAKLNISNFIKLTKESKDQNIKDINFPIRINGRIIRTNSQFKNALRKIVLASSTKLKGVQQIAMCNRSADYVKVTLEVTNETVNAADYIRNN